MTYLLTLHNAIFTRLHQATDSWLLPTVARFVFSATLLLYFWKSASTKISDGFWGFLQPSFGAYYQIFPKIMEENGGDTDALGISLTAVALAGIWAEFILPLLIVLGLFTNFAAVGMIGFVAVQTLTDLYGHGAINVPETLGMWFDPISDSLIVDQRSFWMLLLLTLLIKGAGPLSLDRLFGIGRNT